MPTTAVQDRLVLDRDLELKPYIGPTAATDDFLDFLLDVCKRMADDYLLNEFLDTDGTDLDIPEPVKLGIMVCVKTELELQATSAMVAGPVVMERAGKLMRRYASSISSAGSSSAPPLGARKYWGPYRLEPGF